MIVVIKKWADFANHRMLCIGWFLYHFVIFCLVIINFLFFLRHFNDYKFTPTDESTLLLTFVGFLFAFAGINIYSIFNTNLEAEKHSLQKLSEQYNEKLSESLKSVDFSKSLVRIHIVGNLIVGPDKADYRLLENIVTANNLLVHAKDHVINQKNKIPADQYDSLLIDMKDIASGVKVQILSFLERIASDRNTYFSNFKSQRSIEDVLSKLQGLSDLLTTFEDGSAFIEEHSEEEAEEKVPLKQRFKDAYKAIIRIFNP